MPEPSELPPLIRREIEAKADVVARATPEEREQAAAWQKNFRMSAVNRRKRRAQQRQSMADFHRDVIRRAFDGQTARAIADAHGAPVNKIEVIFSKLGVPRRHKSRPCRTPPLDLKQDTMECLTRFANDRGLSLSDALEKALEILGEDGARALRKLYHMPTQS